MFESFEKSVANGLVMEKGDHILFRELGISPTDKINMRLRGEISRVTKRFYPDIAVDGVALVSDSYKGVYGIETDLRR